MLLERRKVLHERAGDAIEALHAAALDDHLAELAHHYGRSANVRKAVHYLGRRTPSPGSRCTLGSPGFAGRGARIPQGLA